VTGRRLRRLTLRSRLALLTAAAVAVAVAVSAFACWFITKEQLGKQVDTSLRESPVPPNLAERAVQDCRTESGQGGQQFGGPFRGIVQVVLEDGSRCVARESDGALKVTGADVAVAAGERRDAVHDTVIEGGSDDGQNARVYTSRVHGTGPAVSVARPLTELEDSLSTLALLLAAVAAAGVLGAATAGLLIARAALRPVDRLTEAVEHIARTEDLTVRIPVDGKDEIARLGTSFNSMTGALASSQDRQQQLIGDAGHELRTPLTSLRTNVDLLLKSELTGRPLPAGDRRDLLGALRAQMGELSGLIGDLLELSRPDRSQDDGPSEWFALHEVVEQAVSRVRPRGPGISIEADLDPWWTRGRRAALERAVVNLLDNAVKFSPAGGRVEVRLSGGALTVRDHGPGVPEEELPHVFERFWRSPSARSMPGSGLGLSIVDRAVRGAGGTVALGAAPGGGVVARVDLPGTGRAPDG
jgi:two-component system sensor histidine kinase MprB